MIIKLKHLALFAMLSVSAFAGKERGGGDSVKCRPGLFFGEKSYLADLHLADNPLPRETIRSEYSNRENGGADLTLKLLLNFVEQKDPGTAQLLRQAIQKLSFVNVPKVEEIEDGIKLSGWRGFFCRKTQLAVQDFALKRVRYVGKLLEKLPELDQGFFKIHEGFVYLSQTLSDRGASAADIRDKVRAIFSSPDFNAYILTATVDPNAETYAQPSRLTEYALILRVMGKMRGGVRQALAMENETDIVNETYGLLFVAQKYQSMGFPPFDTKPGFQSRAFDYVRAACRDYPREPGKVFYNYACIAQGITDSRKIVEIPGATSVTIEGAEAQTLSASVFDWTKGQGYVGGQLGNFRCRRHKVSGAAECATLTVPNAIAGDGALKIFESLAAHGARKRAEGEFEAVDALKVSCYRQDRPKCTLKFSSR